MSEDTREIVERLRDAPIGTRAPAHGGGAWLKTPRGWKWNGPDSSGGTFPTPGGDWDGRLQPLDAEIVGKVVAELIRIQDTALQSHAVTSLLVRDRDAVAVGAAIIQSQQAEIERLSAQVSAPSGDWVMVPKEPSEAMCQAGERCEAASSSKPWLDGKYTPENVEGIYAAMLAAAPTPPALPAPSGDELVEALANAVLYEVAEQLGGHLGGDYVSLDEGGIQFNGKKIGEAILSSLALQSWVRGKVEWEREAEIVAAYKRGFEWCVENGVDREYLDKAACDYADRILSALSPSSPNTEGE